MQTVKNFFFSCTLGLFALFLALGNFFRLIENSLFPDSLVLSEGLLYLCVVMSAFFLRPGLNRACALIVCIGGIVTSFFYGLYLHGSDLQAGLYAVRLTAIITTIFVLTEITFEKYRGSIEAFFSYLCKAYTVSLVLGFGLYFFFPDSEKLWLLLGDHHVGFQGDPHIGRFVSVYFDPNYYCVIAGLIFFLSYYLYAISKKKRYAIFSFCILLSGLLSWSRSGLALFFALIAYRIFIFLQHGKIRQKTLWLICVCFAFTCLYLAIYREEVGTFLERIFYVFEDDSALCRLRTFEFGLELLAERPWFGFGINFLYRYTIEGIGLTSLDSSLLSLLIQLGIIPFLCLFVYAGYKSLYLVQVERIWKIRETKVPYFFSWLLWYGIGVVFFAAQFNNLLFYPFWVIPFGVILLFLIKKTKREPADFLTKKTADPLN